MVEPSNIWLPLEQAKREIRLLRIAPNADLTAQPECYLAPVSLNQSPKYGAISYAWGDANIKAPIRIDNITWQATTNLKSGLRHLGGKNERKYLWVDALCINQRSTQERNHQVPLMGSIYSQATTVRVWLGEGTAKSSNEACKCWRNLPPYQPSASQKSN